jgi:hypothetical protein
MSIEKVQYNLSLKAESIIYQNEVRCHVNENDFNYSQNPTMLKNGNVTTGSAAYPYFTPKGDVARIGLPIDGTLADNVTGSDFRPYATTIGLFNETGDLLVVGKLATPYPIPSNSDMTFIIRYDS